MNQRFHLSHQNRKINLVFGLLFFWVSLTSYAQSAWRPIGPDDFNQPSYGYASSAANSRIAVRNGKVFVMNIEAEGTNKKWYKFGVYANGSWTNSYTPFFFLSTFDTIPFSFAVDGNETPYLFFNDPLNGDKATVKIFDGTSWSDLGGGTVSTTPSSIKEMAMGSDNKPVILYYEGSVVKVKKFDGVSWISLPASDLDGLSSAVLKLDHNNVPYVLYNGYVKKFNGLGWDEVGITGFSGSGGSMCIDSQNRPYVAIGTSIRVFNGTSWQTLPALPYIYGSLRIDIDANDTIYAGYRNDDFNNPVQFMSLCRLVNGSWQNWGLTANFLIPISFAIDGNDVYEQHTNIVSYPVVRRLVGTDWHLLGDESGMIGKWVSAPDGYYGFPIDDWAFDNGRPLVAYCGNNSQKLEVKQFGTDGIWSSAGVTSEMSILNVKLETDAAGNCYVAYLNSTSSSSTQLSSWVTVRKRVGTSWELMGSVNFSLPAGVYMDFKINHQNIPYVVYKGGRVQKYNGSSWELVGGSLYTGDRDVRLIFTSSDQPYVVYTGSTGPIVKKFNGTSWEEVGTESLSYSSSVKLPRIACDANDTILIAFIDPNKKIVVRRWNGTVWEAVGDPINTGLTTFEGSFLSLAIDNDSVPHLICNNLYGGFRSVATVYKLSEGNWLPLGNPDCSSGATYQGNIAISTNNIPIIMYTRRNGIYCKYFGEQDAFLDIADPLITDTTHITLSPNPVSSKFSVTSDVRINDIAIFDVTGKKVFTAKPAEQMDISFLAPGLYVVQLRTDTGVWSKKIVKN